MESAEYTDRLYEDLKDYLVTEENSTVKVSVIVPCYNVEKYIEKCLTSLIKQTFKDIEIICINDGSTDSTPDLLQVFNKLDTRIKVINQKNGGLSCARNTGIDNAKGEYICFLDSDDWVSENFIEKLYNAIKRNDADIAAGTIVRWRKNHKKYRVHYTEERVFESLKDKLAACSIPKCCYVWNKLYKADLVKNHKFTEGVFFEDILWTPNILKNSGKLVTVSDICYFYRVNNSSIVKKKPNAKKQQDLYNSKKYIVSFFEENGIFLEKKSKVITKRIGYLGNIPVYRIKEYNNEDTFYLFNLIPIYKCSMTKYRDFYKILGLKFTVRKNKKSIKKIREANKIYENSENSIPKVVPRIETLEHLIQSGYSMSRFGDGEFNLIYGESLPFQKYNKTLAKRLHEVLVAKEDDYIVCIPDIFGTLKQYTDFDADFWRKFLFYSRTEIEEIVDKSKLYYDTEVTRPYMGVRDKSVCKKYFEDFKKVWENRDIVFVEGEASRLGVGNDLFDNAKSIKRILCPARDAYSKYDEILSECRKFPKDTLFIIALGPTATILAYDLYRDGYRALDLGHIDIEYEWFIMGAEKKVPIKNKYVNECKKGKCITNLDDKEYHSQIIANLI